MRKVQIKQVSTKNVLQLLHIIAHEIMVCYSVSEYSHDQWKVSGACDLLMSFLVNWTTIS